MSLLGLRDRLGNDVTERGCGCAPDFEGERLVVDASACEHAGRLEESTACRRTVIDCLRDRDAEGIETRAGGLVRAYEDSATALLVAAGRFVEAATVHDERLAERARRDPLAAAHEATGRAGPVADIAAETGLAELAARTEGYETALAPRVGPTVSRWRVETAVPQNGTLRSVRDLPSGGTVRRYERETGVDQYHLRPPEQELSPNALSILDAAYERLASGDIQGDDRAPARAVRAVLNEEAAGGTATTEQTDQPITTVGAVLAKHARGYGLLEDLFADPSVSDVFVTAPAPENPLRLTLDGETLTTNVRLTEEGTEALASRFRYESGRAFSRADPTLDATAEIADRTVRVAGVTDPPSEGTAFAFRAQDETVWTLPALVSNGTLTAAAAALLSVAVERGAAILVAGPRGAGKTTLLGALLWELPPAVRTVAIEDTPELPIDQLQGAGRDVQPLLVSDEGSEISPTTALRTALRLGDGAIAVGEVRGEEAAVLYEAMRVGANSEAVLGTIHGDGADAVCERVVEDLGVPASSFGVTDLIVTTERTHDGDRRVRRIESVNGGETPTFDALFDRTEGPLQSTGRIDRGNSELIAHLATPEESYADVRTQLQARKRLLEAMATQDRTDVEAVTNSHEKR